ncbi:MAG: hypothetical protein V4664_01775 [Patescibacteria group bacterium]
MEAQYRIDGGSEFLMKGFAWTVYGLNFALEITTDFIGIGLFLSPLFMLCMYTALGFWISSKKVSLFSKKTGGQFIISGIISLIPVVNLLYFKFGTSGLPLPGIVGVTSKIVRGSQEEDKERAAEALTTESKGKYKRPSNRPNGESRRYEEEETEEAA